MNKNAKLRFLTSKLFKKILVWFLLIALVPAVYLSYYSYNNARQIIEKEGLTTLISIAELRAQQIGTFFTERERDINAHAENPFIINAMERMVENFTKGGLNSASYSAEEARITPFLSTLTEKFDLHDILFISPDGDIVFSVQKEADLGVNVESDMYKDTEVSRVFRASITHQTTNISAFSVYAPSGEPTIFLCVPIFGADQVLGAMVFQLEPTVIYALATNYSGLGKSGETVIAHMEGDYAVVKAPLRHEPQAAFQMKITMGSADGLPIQDAVKGMEGSGISVDYRGKEILSVWRYIPKLNWGMVVKIDTEEIFAPASSFYRRTLVIGLITVLLVLICAIFVSRSIVNPIIGLNERLGSIGKGEFPAKLDIHFKDEIGEMNESMGKVIDSFKEIVSQANVIAAGDYSSDIALRSDEDELGIALQKMSGSLRTAKEENERNNWIKTGQSELDSQMRGEQNIEKLCRNIITFISRYLKAEIGTLYMCNEDGIFRLLASYAYKARKNLSNEFKLGEGLVGQAALEKQSIILKNVPDDYIYVTSGLGEKKPNNIIVTPFIYNDKVTGVLEIGSFNDFSEFQMHFLEGISDGIAIAMNSAQARAQLAGSFEKTKQQAEELEVTNEELKQQTEALQRSEERLKTQQEELQVSNEELEEQTQFLEKQKDEVAQKNSQLVTAQKDLEEKASELEVSSKYKSEFLANMSHELRTPLNSILILSQQLSQNKNKKLHSKQVEAAEIINSSGNDLLNLINDILDLSKIEAGKITLNIEEFPLGEVANSVDSNFKHLVNEKGLKLVVKIDSALGETIQTDRQKLEQIIKNLMSNAIKFTDGGKITVDLYKPPEDTDLSRSGLNPQKVVAVSVTDTGVGIPKEKQLVIFEAFQQADGSTSRQYGGTGLGLSISRELVRLLGGEIQLSSSEGEGSTFRVYIPEVFEVTEAEDGKTYAELNRKIEFQQVKQKRGIVKKSDAGKIEPSPTIEDDREEIRKGDRVILVIEDDLKFANTLYEFCHERKLMCIHAGDGETGLELVNRYRVDAIILDIRLPGIEGWGVLEALKNNPKTRHIPVHIMSIDDVSIDAMKKGAIGYITKPVDQQQLDEAFTTIENLISKKIKDLLVVEDDGIVKNNIVELIGNGDVKIKAISSGKEAINELKRKKYDCVILDLNLPDISGFEILKRLQKTEDITIPPIIIYTAKDITREEEYELQKYTSTIILKGAISDERLLDETALFLHRVVDKLPVKKRKMISKLHDEEMIFEGKKILLADDDMRNVFAISQVLEEKGINVLKAANGKMALDILDGEKDVDLVLMDIMMPVMDGYEAMKGIRKQERFWKLPILALTAKAMRDDRDKCIAAGANDYLPKPVDIGRLLSLMRVWLYK